MIVVGGTLAIVLMGIGVMAYMWDGYQAVQRRSQRKRRTQGFFEE